MELDTKQWKVNILFIIDTLCGAGGTENHLYYLTKSLDKKRFNCTVVSFNIWGSFVEKLRENGTAVYHIPVARYYTFNALLKSFQLRKIIKENMIDIVQTFHYMSDTYGVVTSKLSGVKHVISSRRDMGDTKSRFHFFMNRICNRYINRFITVCDSVGQRIHADEDIAMSKQQTIYNGVDLEKYSVPDDESIRKIKMKLGLSEKDIVIGSIANFRPEKNYDIFFKSFKEVHSKASNLKAVVVGQGPTLDRSRQYCKKNGIYEDVIFTGPVEDVRQYITVMDIACLVPGSNEGFSNALLEEMAMGKPMIVTSVGGNAEAVTDGENGIIIPPYDYRKLADAINRLYNDLKKREEMGRKSREKVEKFFAIEDMIENHEKFYEKIMNGTASRI